ncbi:LPS export ABC transporter periplasmic protein LptC [Spirosoma sp. BT702]|uniref:LPS export ABC transporter periplasmic protein LptC n=1 Tax=Spirosoma profusum TaxID=2771354 RepID=A0A926Y3C2_9BACT|nr:LPS export ABC transporter periplasmic protein LptC [Spirosoma profusum]MBD2703263.1 LPS export ABC transporter periplasmic protein LptC [Spirosoma profusum]
MNNEKWMMKTGRWGMAPAWIRSIFYYSLLIINFSLIACEEPKQAKNVARYTGPVEEINDVKLLYSENALVKVKLTTPKQYRYENDNRKYPEPVNIVFYGTAGEEVTTLRSDSGRYDRAKDLYTVMGNVVVINKQKQEKLLTPELTWNPISKKVYTDKRVTVLSQQTGEKLYGIGLDANQDFSQYSIRKPTGIFNMEGGI